MELPDLPEGYFWRLHSDSFGFMMVEVRRKRKRKWLGSRLIERGMVVANPPVPSAVIETAEWVLEKWGKQEERRAFLAEFRTYEGDYS